MDKSYFDMFYLVQKYLEYIVWQEENALDIILVFSSFGQFVIVVNSDIFYKLQI